MASGMTSKESLVFSQQVQKELAVAQKAFPQLVKKYDKIRSVRKSPSEGGLGARSARRRAEGSDGSSALAPIEGWNPKARHKQVMAAFASESVRDPPHPLYCQSTADFRMGSCSLNFLGLNPDPKRLKTWSNFAELARRQNPGGPRPVELQVDSAGRFLVRQGPMTLGTQPCLAASERPMSAGIPLGVNFQIEPGEVRAARSSPAAALDGLDQRNSAAKSFLKQTMGGGGGGAGEPNPYAVRKIHAPKDPSSSVTDLRSLFAHGVSHEGEGRRGYLKARLNRHPVEKFSRPVATSHDIGWSMPVCGKEFKPGQFQMKTPTKAFWRSTPVSSMHRFEDAGFFGGV